MIRYHMIVQYDSSVQCVYGTVAAINLYYNSTCYDTQYHHVSSSYCTVHIKYDTQTTVPGTVPGYSTRYGIINMMIYNDILYTVLIH
jgi:hypothetical protein